MADSKFYLFAHSSKYSRQASSLSSLSRLSSSLILCYGHANDMREEVKRGVGGTSATHPGIITPVSCSFLLPAPPLDDVSPSFSLSLSHSGTGEVDKHKYCYFISVAGVGVDLGDVGNIH